MSLNKAIEHGKEHRKQYTGAKYNDSSCRNHGDCPRCRKDRMYQQMKQEEASRQALEEVEDEEI